MGKSFFVVVVVVVIDKTMVIELHHTDVASRGRRGHLSSSCSCRWGRSSAAFQQGHDSQRCADRPQEES